MPPSKAQAEKTRRDAEADIRKDGARVTILYDGGVVDAATGAKPEGSAPSVKLYALIGGYKDELIDGRIVQPGDLRLIVADRSLAGLSLAPLASIGGEPSETGYWAYFGGNPERHPEPVDPPERGVRRLAITRLEQTVYEGGYPVLRVLQARG